MPAHHDIFQHGHVAEKLHYLKGAGYPLSRDAKGRQSLNTLVLKKDQPVIRPQHPGDQIEQGRLAGAVGADEGLDLARTDLKGDPLDSLQSSEGDADVF